MRPLRAAHPSREREPQVVPRLRPGEDPRGRAGGLPEAADEAPGAASPLGRQSEVPDDHVRGLRRADSEEEPEPQTLRRVRPEAPGGAGAGKAAQTALAFLSIVTTVRREAISGESR